MTPEKLKRIRELASEAPAEGYCKDCITSQITHVARNCDVFCENEDCGGLVFSPRDALLIAELLGNGEELVARAEASEQLADALRNVCEYLGWLYDREGTSGEHIRRLREMGDTVATALAAFQKAIGNDSTVNRRG